MKKKRQIKTKTTNNRNESGIMTMLTDNTRLVREDYGKMLINSKT